MGYKINVYDGRQIDYDEVESIDFNLVWSRTNLEHRDHDGYDVEFYINTYDDEKILLELYGRVYRVDQEMRENDTPETIAYTNAYKRRDDIVKAIKGNYYNREEV